VAFFYVSIYRTHLHSTDHSA